MPERWEVGGKWHSGSTLWALVRLWLFLPVRWGVNVGFGAKESLSSSFLWGSRLPILYST